MSTIGIVQRCCSPFKYMSSKVWWDGSKTCSVEEDPGKSFARFDKSTLFVSEVWDVSWITEEACSIMRLASTSEMRASENTTSN